MIFRNLLWSAIVDAKYWECYISHYIDRRRRKEKWLTILVLVFSSSGVLGWKIWEPYPAVVCAVLGVLQIIDMLRPSIAANHEEYESLVKIRYSSGEVCSQLEQLWVRLHDNQEDLVEIQKVFFGQCRPKMNQIQQLSDSLIVPCNNKRIIKIATKETSKYLANYENA